MKKPISEKIYDWYLAKYTNASLYEVTMFDGTIVSIIASDEDEAMTRAIKLYDHQIQYPDGWLLTSIKRFLKNLVKIKFSNPLKLSFWNPINWSPAKLINKELKNAQKISKIKQKRNTPAAADLDDEEHEVINTFEQLEKRALSITKELIVAVAAILISAFIFLNRPEGTGILGTSVLWPIAVTTISSLTILHNLINLSRANALLKKHKGEDA